MIGRSDELGRLREALAAAEAGTATAVLVGGEAGIGKTRLITEFVASMPSSVRVLQGGCVPLTDGLLPYGPVIELLRALEQPLDLLAPTTAAADQYRVFAALSALLDRLAAETTLVVVLEDLHWADPSTRALLAYLVHGRTAPARLLLIGSYRSDELTGRHPLRALLSELDRDGVTRIELGRLGPDETAAQIAGVLDSTVDHLLAERLHARCDGNPFLVEELLAAGPDTDPLPAGTRDILLRRVRRLSTVDQAGLLAIAVAGRRADHALLARVLCLDADALADRLRPAVDEQLLVVDGDGYAFRHALVAEALLAEALPGERVRLHRAYAEALARRRDTGGDDATWAATAAEIAYHWDGAGEPARGPGRLRRGRAGGRAAVRPGRGAPALRPGARGGGPTPGRPDPRWISSTCAGTGPRRPISRATPGTPSRWSAGPWKRSIPRPTRPGPACCTSGSAATCGPTATPSRSRSGPTSRRSSWSRTCRTAGRARVLTGLASALVYADRPDPSPWCEEAVRVARAAGARREEGRALQSLGYYRAMVGDVEAGLAHCRQALAIAAEAATSEDHCRAYVSLVGVLRMAGRVNEAAQTGMEGVGVARRRGADRTYGNLLLGDAIEALTLVGRWDEADELLPGEPDAAAHGTPLIATNLWLSAANLHTWRGRFDRSQRFLDACMAAYAVHGHGHVRSSLHVHQSEQCLWQGQYAEAAGWVRRELDLAGATGFTSVLSHLVVQGLRAEAGLPARRPARLVELLEDMSRRPDPPPDAAALIVMAWAELGRVRGDPDPERWDESADHWTKIDMPWPLAYVRWRKAETLLARRPSSVQRRSGAAALSEAYAIADPPRRRAAAA